jgi:Ca2+-transporting ATPase
VLTGEELDALPEQRQREAIGKTTVFARVSPRHKLMIVRALRAQNHITAMTGDGVNDAPAVREADIGVSMGLTGTDVTREASDLVLMDDNFATLVAAVEEGRAIYQNIRGFIRYLLACNIGEVLTMFLGILMGMPVVLMPIHILLVNLVTDGLPAIALGLEPAAKGLMDRPPRGAGESIFSRGLLGKILFRGCLIGLTTLFVFGWFLPGGDLTLARTAAFVTLVFSQLLHVFECRSEEKPIWRLNPFGNPKLIGAVCISAAITILAVWCPPLQGILGTEALPLQKLPVIGGALLFAPFVTAIFDNLFATDRANTQVQENKSSVFSRNVGIFDNEAVDISKKIR